MLRQRSDRDWLVLLIGGHSATGKTIVSERIGPAVIRAVFLVESDESTILESVVQRGREMAGLTQDDLANGARAKWLFGQWLAQEAARYDLPIVEPRPWDTLVERLIDRLA